jgi:uncharacterized protein YjbI with pentapeptide repeats
MDARITYNYWYPDCIQSVDFIESIIMKSKFDNLAFERVNSDNSKFNKCYYENVVFDSCNLRLTQFDGISIKKVKFVECNFVDVVFDGFTIDNLDFYNCKFVNIQFKNCKINSSCVNLCAINGLKFTKCELNMKVAHTKIYSVQIDDKKLDVNKLTGFSDGYMMDGTLSNSGFENNLKKRFKN